MSDTPTRKPRRKIRGSLPASTFDTPPVVTRHTLDLPGRTLEYSAHVGMMPMKNDNGDAEAGIFYMAYMREAAPDGAPRPIMFSFNGGPGSASVWLHLGALGPKRVATMDGGMPPPPYAVIPNEHTWLDETDLVFIDPVGTGYSRPKTPEVGKKYWGINGDIESIAEFIRLFLTRFQRWSSPIFIVGESYGTTRAAGLAGHLINRGIALNGIVLVSSILNFQTARFAKGNDLPYILFLPTYTATAWYHGCLAPDLQKDLKATLREVEAWAAEGYATALAKGDALGEAERRDVIQRLARYTGLSEQYIDETDLRVQIHRFCKELLRRQKRTVGRLDSRFMGIDAIAVTEAPDYDPSIAVIMPPYTSAFNDYVRRELEYRTDDVYQILGTGIKSPWDWGSAGDGYPDTADALRSAFSKNPHMRVFVASGYFDLATPYFATEYTLSHMGLDPELRGNITTGYYEAGHMMYVHGESLARLKEDVSRFVEGSVRKG
ncbi:MAG: peptidase S10 [Chthonomonadales bacterium]|nr:peptidase S10 [Chthonomonadales bacterium]